MIGLAGEITLLLQARVDSISPIAGNNHMLTIWSRSVTAWSRPRRDCGKEEAKMPFGGKQR